MRGQTVHEQHLGFSQIQQRLINLIRLKRLAAIRFLTFVPHRRPNIGDHQISISDSFTGCSNSLGVATTGKNVAIRLVGIWARDAQLKVPLSRRINV